MCDSRFSTPPSNDTNRFKRRMRRVRPRHRPAALSGEGCFKALLDASADYAFMLDPEGVVLALNAGMARRLGRKPDDLLGKCIYGFLPPDTLQQRKAIVEQVLRTRSPCVFEDVTRSGEILEARLHPIFAPNRAVLGVGVFLHSISRRKRAEEEQLQLRSAIEQAAEGFLLMDQDFMVEYANQAFESMTGYPLSSIKGKSAFVLYQGVSQQRGLRKILTALAEGESWTGRTYNTRRDGSVFLGEKTVSPIRGKGGTVLGYVSVQRDVTHLAELEKQLRQAQKMEAIGALAGGIAHDFNNILGPIILHSELNIQALEPGDPVRRSFSEILGAANRAKALVSQIINLSRRQEMDEPVPFGLGSIAKECVELLRPTLPATIAINFNNEARDDVVLADPTQTHQVIMNLCTNAAHAMRDRGGVLSVTLADDVEEEPPYGRFSAIEPGRYVRLTVADSGHGMAPEVMERIFEPFFTTKGDGLGAGLGLAVVRSVIDRMEGRISVESEPGKGAVFQVLFPKTEDWSGEEPALKRSPPVLRGKERILLVEDEASLVVGVRAVLEKQGYGVTACQSGDEALALMSKTPDGFDLVLADVTMPGMTGVELAEELLALRPSLPIILCTGYTTLITPEEARRMGVRAFLKKPYGMNELGAAVRSVLDEPQGAPEPDVPEKPLRNSADE